MKKSVLILSLLCTGALAQDKEPLQLNLSGEIAIDTTGSVYQYNLRTITTPEIKKLLDSAVAKWRFEPVVRNGMAVNTKGLMYLSLTATPEGAGYRLRIDQVQFGGTRENVMSKIAYDYPSAGLRSRTDAEVVAALRVGADGKVMQAAAVQSRLLDVKNGDKKTAHLLKGFEESAVKIVKTMKFKAVDPASGEPSETTLVIPVAFCASDGCTGQRGSWQPATNGSGLKPIPWLSEDKQRFDANGLEKGQSIALDGGDLKLQTRVVGTSL